MFEMFKKILTAISLFSLLLLATPALAARPENGNASPDVDIPERNGTYDIPGRPDLKVRVFVHAPRPKPSTPPSLICGLQDPDSSTVDAVTPWHLPTGQWAYQLNTASVPSSIGASNFSALTGQSFNAWSATDVGQKVVFNRGQDTSIAKKALDGRNIIAWGRTSGTALAVTYTWYYPSTGLVAEVDTIFNKKFPWSWSPYSTGCADPNSYDAQDILTHELGHWMGIDDNSNTSFANNTMYAYGAKGEIKKDTLTTGDITAVNQLY